jgi:hypothetical protein
MMCQGFGALPTRNFSSGQFEGAENISGEVLRQTMLSRGGDCETSHACMAGCTIRSSNIFGDVDGRQSSRRWNTNHRPDGLQPGIDGYVARDCRSMTWADDQLARPGVAQ